MIRFQIHLKWRERRNYLAKWKFRKLGRKENEWVAFVDVPLCNRGDYGDFGASTNTKNISSLIFLFFLHGTFFLVRNFFSFLCYTLFTSALYLYKLAEVFFLVAFYDWFFYTTFLLYIFCRYLPCSYIPRLNILLVIISYSHVHLPRRHLRFWSCYFLVSLRNHSIHYR